ncbi:MAG: peptidase M14 [Bordetella sp.]|uniref:peptidase M14 n=1 Tax=Bordetella sp. TaxID=28081 RepID=UPI003F7BEED7
MSVLLEQNFERTLDAWVREFSDPSYEGAQIEAWLFEDEAARRDAERRLADAGVTAKFRSAYKPLVHYFLEDADRDGLQAVSIRYPVHEAALATRFTLEAYPLAGMLEGVELSFAAGDDALYYGVELRYEDGRTKRAWVYAPNRLGKDYAGQDALSPTGWVRAVDAGGVRLDEARDTELSLVYEAAMDAVSGHPWGDSEPYFERLEIRIDIPAIERALGYGDEVMSTVEALHEDIYFGLLEVFQRHSGRPLGSRGLQPGQIIPDVRRAAQGGGASVRVSTEAYDAVTDVAPDAPGLPLEQIDAPLTPARIAHEMRQIGGEPYAVRTRQGRPVLCTYVQGSGPAVLISGGQHANEASGVVGALRAAHTLKKRPGAHFALIASENPDGYAMYARLREHNPRHMLHAARYSALGDDLAYREREPAYESAARRQALDVSGAQLHVNLHGYPAHEWTRPLAGYLPRGFESWTLPKGFFLLLRHHPGWGDKARALMAEATRRLAERMPELAAFNARQLAVFRAHALEQGFETMHGIPVLVAQSEAEAAPLALIAEFPDETLYGEAFRFAQSVQTETVLAAVQAYLAL